MKTRKTNIRDSYLEMIQRFPLRTIRTKSDCEQATLILDKWFGRSDLDPGQADYIEVLANLVADYEESNESALEQSDPVEIIKHLMEARGMTTTDLGRLLGSRSLASSILSNKRQISKSAAIKLADYFSVDASVFS